MSRSTNRRAKRIINPEWVLNIPELETRPLLLRAMANRVDIRRKVFQVAAALESIALIPSRAVAGECLALWWKKCRKEIQRYYHDKLRSQTGDDALFNEFRGCLKNVYLNMLLKSGNALPRDFKGNEWHITRDYD